MYKFTQVVHKFTQVFLSPMVRHSGEFNLFIKSLLQQLSTASIKAIFPHIKLIALEGEHLLPLASRIVRTQVLLLRLRINVSLGK